MPYVRQRTWLQMAPRMRIVGRRGMGQAATCPSVEQLMGITDSNDPCQNPIASLPISTATVPVPLSPSAILARDLAPYLPGTPGYTALPTYTTSQFLQQYKTPLLIGGIGFGALLLIKALR
jgi:hypothetical protein